MSKSLDWLDLKWIRPETFVSFEYENPSLLYLLVLIPFIFLLRLLLFVRFRQKVDVAFFQTSLKTHWSVYLRLLPDIFLACIFGFLIVGFARPQKTTENLEKSYDGIDIMVVLDISESMKLQDLKPDRLQAAKEVAREFVSGRLQDRIGIVVFSGEAFSLSPLTNDYDLLTRFIEDIDFSMIQKSGTAIGLAIGVATNRLIESQAKSKVMILISDGENTAGNIDPFTAARLATSYKIKIYSIGIGKDGPVLVGTDPFGNNQYIDNTMDETTLKSIARIGQGEYYRASSNQGLKQIFSTIDRLEKSEYKEKRFKNTTDFYHIYLYWAILFFFLWLTTKSSFISNPVED